MNTPQYHSHTHWTTWLDQLALNDFVYVDNFIPETLYQQIQQYFQLLFNDHQFAKAAIGSSVKRQVQSSIRGDFIYWLDKEIDNDLRALFYLFDEVTQNLKQHLFLSLSDYEFHFALYPPETRYNKHLDQFQGNNNRVISMLIYLNDDWKAGDGGELKIYRPDGNDVMVEPLANRMVIFKSDTVEHEVMLTHAQRKSLTGWLLHQPARLGKLV